MRFESLFLNLPKYYDEQVRITDPDKLTVHLEILALLKMYGVKFKMVDNDKGMRFSRFLTAQELRDSMDEFERFETEFLYYRSIVSKGPSGYVLHIMGNFE